MRAEQDLAGWAWFETAQPGGDAPDPELCRTFARCFAGAEGDAALRHLERLFLLRRLPAQASDAELRHLEGQRHVVAYIAALVMRGRG